MDKGLICVGDTDLDLFICTREPLGHHSWEAGRRMVWTQACQDARRGLLDHEEAHLQDLGEGDGVDRPLTLKLYNTLDPQRRGVLRQILANAVWTRHARARLLANLGMSPVCTYCDRGEIENTQHLWWRCSAWTTIRSEYFPGVEDIVERYKVSSWPCCTRSCGIFNQVYYDCLAKEVQNVMIDIYLARLAQDRQGVGLAVVLFAVLRVLDLRGRLLSESLRIQFVFCVSLCVRTAFLSGLCLHSLVSMCTSELPSEFFQLVPFRFSYENLVTTSPSS